MRRVVQATHFKPSERFWNRRGHVSAGFGFGFPEICDRRFGFIYAAVRGVGLVGGA